MWIGGYTGWGYGATNGRDAQALTTQYGWSSGLKKKLQPLAQNAQDAALYMNRACELYCARFRWEGDILDQLLIPPSYIETLLLNFGYCLLAKYDGQILILPANATKFNNMGIPTHYSLMSYKQVVLTEIKADDCVIIRANPICLPAFGMLNRLSGMVADLNRTFEVYANGMKKPLMIATNQDSALTNQIISEKILDNNYFIMFENKNKVGLEPAPPLFHNTGHNSQDLLGIAMAKDEIFAEMNKQIGIRANPKNTKAYTSETEVDNHNSEVELTIGAAFNCREKAAEQMSDFLGSKITCINVSDELEPINDDTVLPEDNKPE